MNILQISGFDLLGKQVNGYLLHEYFLKRGHCSSMIVSSKSSNDEKVRSLSSTPFWNKLNVSLSNFQNKLSTHCILPTLSLKTYFMHYFREADIVNLQLIHNSQFFSLLNLPIMSRLKRTILSIHDMFMMTGHCVYSMDCEKWKTGCGACPDLQLPFVVQEDRTAENWNLKKWIFKNSKLDLVVGSPWQYERVKQSPILSHLPLHYIPYGVDTQEYYVRDKARCRARFGIPEHADVISFRSVPFSRNFKGTQFIEKALANYQPRKETYLLTFEGIGGLMSLRDKYKFVELGWVYDTDLIADALNATDIFLMPSTAEAFGLMAIESMACGTPVIVFEGTALPQTINAPSCGMAVPYEDSEALMGAINILLKDDAYRLNLRQNALQHVADKHTFEAYADRYLTLYEKLINERTV